MVKVKNFSENLEQNFSKLGVEIKRNVQKEEFKDKPIEQVLKHTLENYPLKDSEVKKKTNEELQTPSLNKAPNNAAVYLPSYMSEQSEDVKAVVENLIDLAFKDGLEKALKEVRFYPPFIVDAFHDALVDKIIPELRKRGIID